MIRPANQKIDWFKLFDVILILGGISSAIIGVVWMVRIQNIEKEGRVATCWFSEESQLKINQYNDISYVGHVSLVNARIGNQTTSTKLVYPSNSPELYAKTRTDIFDMFDDYQGKTFECIKRGRHSYLPASKVLPMLLIIVCPLAALLIAAVRMCKTKNADRQRLM